MISYTGYHHEVLVSCWSLGLVLGHWDRCGGSRVIICHENNPPYRYLQRGLSKMSCLHFLVILIFIEKNSVNITVLGLCLCHTVCSHPKTGSTNRAPTSYGMW